jgi:hypothetical protein
MADKIPGGLQAALQSTLFWGALCMCATIVLTVVAVMIHDFRWILMFAWPFAAVAAWEFSRTIFVRKVVVLSATGISTAVSGALLFWLYFALAPPPEGFVDKPTGPPSLPVVKGSVEEDELTLTATLNTTAAAATGVRAQTYLIKRVADKVFVSITNETDGPFSLLFTLAIFDGEDDFAKQIMTQVEKMVQAEQGKCKLV